MATTGVSRAGVTHPAVTTAHGRRDPGKGDVAERNGAEGIILANAKVRAALRAVTAFEKTRAGGPGRNGDGGEADNRGEEESFHGG
jgi:hypothetical protein